MYILAFYFKKQKPNSVCQYILFHASKGGPEVLWANMTSGRELGNVRREKSDIGHLKNNSSFWNFQAGKVVSFQSIRRGNDQAFSMKSPACL